MSFTNIVAWNCRRVGGRSSITQVKDLIQKCALGILVIVEPRISGNKAEAVARKLSLNGCFRKDPNDFSRGLYFLCNKNIFNVNIIKDHP